MAGTKINNSGVTFPDTSVQAVAALSGFSNITVFATSGTWTVPAGITKCKVTVVGGGGTGQTGYDGDEVYLGRAGGGGGGTAIEIISGLTPGAGIAVTVGGAAGTSSFSTYCSATGGAQDGSAGTGGLAGVGSGGDLNIGGTAGTSTIGSHTVATGGTGGSSMFGGGGRGGIQLNGVGSAGEAGKAYGGGGGGGVGAGNAGGTGASGVVIIEY